MATSRAGFQVLKASARGPASARLGKLSTKGRKPIDTPNFVAMSSRGVIPHLTPDMVIKATDFGAAHMALEDCMHKPNTCVSMLWTKADLLYSHRKKGSSHLRDGRPGPT